MCNNKAKNKHLSRVLVQSVWRWARSIIRSANLQMFFLTANKSHDKILESVCWDLLTARKTWSDLFFEQTEIQEITEEWCKCGNNTCSRKSHSVFVTVFFLSSINFKLHMLSFCCPLVATGGLCFWNTPPRVVCHQYNVSWTLWSDI